MSEKSLWPKFVSLPQPLPNSEESRSPETEWSVVVSELVWAMCAGLGLLEEF